MNRKINNYSSIYSEMFYNILSNLCFLDDNSDMDKELLLHQIIKGDKSNNIKLCFFQKQRLIILIDYGFNNLNEEEIKFLLDRGDDTNLSISYFNNHVKFLESLVLKIPSKCSVDDEGKTLLTYSLSIGSYRITKYLLDQRA
ncbi:hypothetical protein H8356DRAFT_1330200 [Neocallimastix lanati (nom. inval.)]|nr:hypothetical protein H8356DRAFT_1330200 [Neocallimastix sp. JGI-2020a]